MDGVIRTSTSHSASIHLPFRIHALLQLEPPDVEPPVKKGTLVSCSRHREDASRKKNQSWFDTPPDVLCTGNNIFESRAPLVVCVGDGFQVRTASPVAWQFTNYGRGGERYKTLQGLQSRSRGKWNMENVTGVFWHFALWAGLKRFKHQLRSESGSYEYESPAWEDALHSFYSVDFRGVDIYKEANLRGIWHLWLWVLPEIFSLYFNWWNKVILAGDRGLSEIW